MLGRPRSKVDILVVCTANVCRSQYIAEVMRTELPELTITSAGVKALVGALPDDLVLKALADQGCDGSGIAAARQLTDKLVRRSRLIITAARMHRAFVVSLDMKAASRTYTLKELAHLLDPSPGGLGIEGVLAQARLRSATVGVPDIDEDLADPHGQLEPAYRRMADDIAAAMDVLVPALRR